jgi:basic membrane protein A
MIAIVAVIAIVIVGAGIYLMQPPVIPPTEKLKMAVLLPGSITDAGWNSAMYTGASALQSEMTDNLTITIAEGLGQVGVAPTMRDYASRGYKILICWTIQYTADAMAVHNDFNDTFFIVTSAYQTAPNVIGLDVNLWESAYLAGLAMGGLSNSNIVGGVAGFNYATTAAVPRAFFLGCQRANPAITALPIIFGGVWDDVNKGAEVGAALIAQGADIIISRGDGLSLGVIQAATAASHPGTADTVYMCGDMADQNALAPKVIVTSNIVFAKQQLKNIYQMVMNGSMAAVGATPDRLMVWGVHESTSGIAPFHGLEYKISAAAKDLVNRCKAAMIAGTFRVDVNRTSGALTVVGTF